MDGIRLEPLEIIDIIKATGTIGYTWDLERDLIDWRGPLNLLLSPEAPFKTGSSYHNFLSTHTFYKRVQALMHLKSITNEYQCAYMLTLPNYKSCPVLDEGEVFFDKNGQPYKLQGTLTFLEDDLLGQLDQNHSGYDSLTGLPEKELILETLSCFIDQAIINHQGGAYIALMIDHLEYITCRFGLQTTQIIIEKVGEALRGTIRFDDFIGRSNGCGFGLILKNCDHWGLVRAYQRIAYAIQELKIYEQDQLIEIPISMGGVVFPREGFTPAKIMARVERYLFESQQSNDVKTAYVSPQASSYFPRSHRAQEGMLRHTDKQALQA
ncbi:hypothetical protein IM40_07185 [Candidatus Paracaedimonas acanthamoebae]|nr:hypothetical protein IM40_07185 [Candidatus Paracaedimonas acanthamoebae]